VNVKLLASGETVKVGASYGMRLIEQGKAVLAPETPKRTPKKEPPKAVMPDGAEGKDS
jgi:hypothetical protein